MDEGDRIPVNMPRVVISGVPIDDIGAATTARLIARWASDGSGGYICTPNVDHVVRARRDPQFRAVLKSARLRVPDGMGIVYGSRLAGVGLSGTVTGRLLPEAVGRELLGADIPMALFGGQPGTAERAAAALRREAVLVSDALSPPMGFVVGSPDDAAAVERLRASRAQVVFVGLGSPKQELWMAAHANDLPGAVLVGVGAAIDVLGGRVPAAPRWMTRVGLEWVYRLAHEPCRLAPRYLRDDPRFFWWMVQTRLGRPHPSRPSDR